MGPRDCGTDSDLWLWTCSSATRELDWWVFVVPIANQNQSHLQNLGSCHVVTSFCCVSLIVCSISLFENDDSLLIWLLTMCVEEQRLWAPVSQGEPRLRPPPGWMRLPVPRGPMVPFSGCFWPGPMATSGARHWAPPPRTVSCIWLSLHFFVHWNSTFNIIFDKYNTIFESTGIYLWWHHRMSHPAGQRVPSLLCPFCDP